MGCTESNIEWDISSENHDGFVIPRVTGYTKFTHKMPLKWGSNDVSNWTCSQQKQLVLNY